ncbi:MAG: hypothetical protein WCF77_03580 [Minisyncoccia bacterium]
MRRKYTETKQERAAAELGPEVLFENSGFKVLYLTISGSQHRFDRVVILYDGIPVWTMSSEGWCREDAVPFLENALMKAYNHRDFVGGRGPCIVPDPENGMLYENTVDGSSSWRRFRGREEIFDRNDQCIGWREYHGILLAE